MTATHPYAQFLGNRDPFEVLAETQKTIPAIAQKLGPEGLKRSYGPGKWTGAQVLAHLADCEIAFGFRVRQIVSEPQLPIQPFDENNWSRHYDKANGAEAAQAFQALRAFNLSAFRNLTAEERQRAAKHPDRGLETADTVIRILAGHTLNHLAQLEKIVSTATAA
jgi:uncharacterized damage-inducible protein DinB